MRRLKWEGVTVEGVKVEGVERVNGCGCVESMRYFIGCLREEPDGDVSL